MMHWNPRGWTLIGMLLLAIPGAMTVMKLTAAAQATSASAPATTQVTDTIFLADGTPATGSVIVSWQAFTTASGQAVPSGTTSATIAGGALSLQLVPNVGSTPMGTYYTAVYHLNDGSVSREFWVVPVSQFPVLVSAIKTTVLPTSVAMQTVSKSYVDTVIAAAVTGHPLDSSSPFVMKTGDTMTGALVLPGDPTTPNDAADKHYVDVNIAATGGGLGQKVSLLPSATQAVAQPVGTQLQVNNLNGAEYASQYVSGLGGNGIANALASPDCASGCNVKVERTYTSPENYLASAWNSGSGGTHVEDDRNGQRNDVYLNPTSPFGNDDAGQVIDVTSTRNTAAEFAAGGSGIPSSYGLVIKHEGLTGGSNLFPQSIESVPYFKTNFDAINVTGIYNAMGQHALDSQTINCYGVGDCLIGSQFMSSSGGFRDEADEGAHPYDLQIQEDSRVFQGTCSSGCTTGSTTVRVATISAPGTQGEGRFLIDKNPAKTITSGLLTGGTSGTGTPPGPKVTFSGTNFPISVFLATAQTITSQANNIAPGTVTVSIATSGVTPGFATNTAAVPSPMGAACVVDQSNGFTGGYEMANYTVVDGSHLRMTLNKTHAAGATIAFGGLCGYGLEQTVDTVGSIRQVFPVIGSYSPTGLYYAGALVPIVGVQSNTSAFLNVTLQVAAIARNNNVVTVTTAGALPVDVNGLTMTVAGVADQSYNGSFTVTSTGTNTLTYSQTGANSTSSGGNVSKLTGGYVLYPMAEVLGVFDTATKSVDGQMTLAANTVPWGVNDPLEEPHFYQEKISGDIMFVGQTTPRATLAQTAGVEYQQNVGPGMSGWTISNAVPAANYLGNGGTHTVPAAAYVASGIWAQTMSMQAGEQNVFSVHCNSHGCGRWNSGYNLFALDSSVGGDTISYQPQTSALQMTLRGTGYQFTPQAFTAGTINAGTVNATTLNGAVNASQLPLFGASGSTHARGAVPDPGATAGMTRYLREDGSWAVPAGTSGSGGLGVGTGSSGGTPIAGAIADYNFLDGAGTTLTDHSGNGNNATLEAGALTPTWTSTGLSFQPGQGVALPATVNGAQTFLFGVYTQPLTAGAQTTNNFPALLTSSLGNSGASLILSNFTSFPYNLGSPYVPAAFTSSVISSCSTTVAGFHVIAFEVGIAGSSVDHLFVDGVECAYASHGATGLLQTSGNYFIGAGTNGPFAGSAFLGTVYRAAFLPTTLTASAVAQYSKLIANDISSRGVATSPAQVTLAGATIHFIGDSITLGQGATTPYTTLIAPQNSPTFATVNWGIGTTTIASTVSSEPQRVATECQTAFGPAIATVFLGTNDWALASPTPTGYTVVSGLLKEIQILKGAGCGVFVATMISRTGQDANKDTYDAQILRLAKAGGADGVIDVAADPLLGADGASSNATYFQADDIHPTNAGHIRIANAFNNALSYYFGYNAASPHSITAASYAMQAGDGYITSNPTVNQTLTLPDCTGQSGAVYTVANIQAGFTVSVLASGSSQLINGLSVGTAVKVPSNGSVSFRDVPNPKTVSGCHWEM
jgi:lysophospholipase L1-like esterase